jgi:Na+:H+ antiporter, NhaA family
VGDLFRSERHSAAFLFGAAVLGLIVANVAGGENLVALKNAHFPIQFLSLNLTAAQWVSDFLLAIFFFIVAIELKFELTSGELNSWGKALVPSIAAVGGVTVPALLYMLISRSDELLGGWPIPTATDIAFALGVLAIFGKGLPAKMRAFLLALAVLDDLIGIAIIAIFFAGDLDWLSFLAAILCVAGFSLVARSPLAKHGSLLVVSMVVLALAAWYFVQQSGVHPTVAGVLLGLGVPQKYGDHLAERILPWSNAFVLPLFAFTAALVSVPADGFGGLRPAFFAVAVALPLGKLIGITLGGLVAALITRGKGTGVVTGWDLIALAMTGGIGFTVALLMNELAYVGQDVTRDQGVLGVLAGSAVSVILGAALIAWRAARHRRLAQSEASALYPAPH